MTYKYNFRTTNGAVCCQTNNPAQICATPAGLRAFAPTACPRRHDWRMPFRKTGPLIAPSGVTPEPRSKPSPSRSGTLWRARF